MKTTGEQYRGVGSSRVFCALVFGAVLAVASVCVASEKKISFEFQGGVGGLTPIQDHRAQITLTSTDAETRTDTRSVKAQALDGENSGPSKNIDANAMSLTCGAFTVNLVHAAITVQKDSNSNLDYFDYTPFTLDQDDVAAIAPPITTNPIWCTMNIPQSGGSTWTFPYAFRLDEEAPDVTTASNLITYPVIPLAGGIGRWNWSFSDPKTPPDPNGDPTTCGAPEYSCNQSDARYQYQVFYKKKTDSSYQSVPVASSGPSYMTADVDKVLSTEDRFLVTDTSKTYCYTLRVEDTAGNFSEKAGTADERCYVPDGAKPVFKSVEFFKDSSFTTEFPKDTSGNYTVTSNPCYFDTATCSMAGQRFIYLKLVFSEPLFDGQFWGGYTSTANDLFDNDNDGNIDEEGNSFNNLDDDGDGFVDEDVSTTGCTVAANVNNNKKDDDCDGYVDEEPGGANGKDDDGDGLIDEDTSSASCPAKNLWSYAQQSCFPSPRISIQGPDIEGFVPGIPSTNNANDQITWKCTAWGGNSNPICAGYATGTTVYSYKWEVTGNNPPVGLIEGLYDITLVQGKDASGNDLNANTPVKGGSVMVDNTGPSVTVQYYSNDTFTTGMPNFDHDGSDEPTNACSGNADTSKMPIAREGKLYIQLVLDEYSGATPTLTLYKPNDATPAKAPYCGIAQNSPAYTVNVPVYTSCGQSPLCNPCTGANCSQYNYQTTPCMVFRACYDVASTTVFNGYVGVSVWARDRTENMKWDPDNAHAAASQEDLNGLSDDSNGDGLPTYIPGAYETDATVTAGQYFAIDYYPPAAPAMALPITPCDGDIARSGQSCSSAVSTTKSPIISWTKLSNNTDDDSDGTTDEETYDESDNDGDGRTDEDCVAPATGTMGWEIRSWHLQVATDPSFSTSTMVLNDLAVDTSKAQMTNLPERATSAPYYWRVAAYDTAGNEGPWSPASGTTHPGYYTFGVDITPPSVSVEYYSDSLHTTKLVRNDANIPVTKDTASAGKKIYVVLTSNELVQSALQYKLKQNGSVKITATTTVDPFDSKQYFGSFEVDAAGSGQLFTDGLADFLVYAVDLSGNTLNFGTPATGTQIFVDTSSPVINAGDVSASPNPASMDNDGDGMTGETVDDAVTVSVQASEYLKAPFRVRVKQNNFPDIATLNDAIDNDCDGSIDEEAADGIDNDLDGRIDEDTGTLGALPGSGCFITMTADGITPGSYTGLYNVIPGYDGTVQIYVGDISPLSPYAATDYAGNAVYATGTFKVDTVAPDAPTLAIPLHEKHVSNTSPLLGWQMANRTTDLAKYRVQVDSSQSFASPVVDITTLDDGISTTFYYTVPGPLADGKYYWRAYSYDTAKNRSVSSVVSAFYVDTLPPSPPKFDAVQTPTVERSSALSGTAEANSQVEIYVNGIVKGIVTTGNDGKFTVGIDDDGDGVADEDPVDDFDNDLDGYTDEDPPGVFLEEGDNIIEGRVIDSAGNYGTQGCDATTPFYNGGQGKCIIVLDSGAPTFKVLYFSDAQLTTPLPFSVSTNRFIAKAGKVYLRIIASEDLPAPPTFSVNQQGSTDVANSTTSSINGSTREFTGTYTVFAKTGGAYVDGDAKVTVKGTDAQGNTTPNGTEPSVGALFNIDTTGPTFKVRLYRDSLYTERLTKDQNMLPNAKAGKVYMRIIANEPQTSAPKVTVDQQGTADIVDALSSAVVTNNSSSTLNFNYIYTASTADGGANIDGRTTVAINGTDIAGNNAVGVTPSEDPVFIIDTAAPAPPSINLSATSTIYSQVTASGTSEPYSNVQVFVVGNENLSIDDNKDNDHDGRVDEEPADGADNDNDGFIDEDTTTHLCTTTQFWDTYSASCAQKPSQTRENDGESMTGSSGAFTLLITGIAPGKNLIYGKAFDYAGNDSGFSSGTPLFNNAPQIVTLTHTFDPGWNLAGIPLQPSVGSPTAVFGQLAGVYRLQSGAMATGSSLSSMAPGMCYWAYFGSSSNTVTMTGLTSTTREVPLTKGWNMVGLPYNYSTPWDATIMVKVGTDEFALGTASANNYLEPKAYFYDPAADAFTNAKGIADSLTLEPWVGFLVKAESDCTIVFPEK